jgi:hypothetical protein
MEELLLFDDPIAVGPDAKAHDVLVSIYRNPRMSWRDRMRAAALAIAYESPKLAVTASVPFNETFANLLDRATRRSEKVMKVIPASIEPKPEPDPPKPTRYKPHATIDVRRFRRRF